MYLNLNNMSHLNYCASADKLASRLCQILVKVLDNSQRDCKEVCVNPIFANL